MRTIEKRKTKICGVVYDCLESGNIMYSGVTKHRADLFKSGEWPRDSKENYRFKGEGVNG